MSGTPECRLLDAHAAALAAVLRGPRGLRDDVVAEVRDGLHDAAAAHRAAGLGDAEAAGRAVAEFGSVAELAPQFQDELTTAQARRTALVVVVLFPALLLGWDLLWAAGVGWPSSPSPVVGVLARGQDVASAVITGAGLVLLAATLRRGIRPRPLAAATAAVALLGTAACVATAVVMNLVNGAATVAMLASSPVAGLAFAVTTVLAGTVATSSVRTLRLVRARHS